MAIMTFIFTPIVFDPMQMYQGMGQEDLTDLPATVLDAMKHMSIVYSVLQLLSASIIVCEVFTHNSPRLGMSSIVLSWMLNLIIQFVFPWPAKALYCMESLFRLVLCLSLFYLLQWEYTDTSTLHMIRQCHMIRRRVETIITNMIRRNNL
eukprot:232438_1